MILGQNISKITKVDQQKVLCRLLWHELLIHNKKDQNQRRLVFSRWFDVESPNSVWHSPLTASNSLNSIWKVFRELVISVKNLEKLQKFEGDFFQNWSGFVQAFFMERSLSNCYCIPNIYDWRILILKDIFFLTLGQILHQCIMCRHTAVGVG